MNRPLVVLNNDEPDSRWLVFPTLALLSLYQRRTRGRWGYAYTWLDTQGYGFHGVTWERLAVEGGVPNQVRRQSSYERITFTDGDRSRTVTLRNVATQGHLLSGTEVGKDGVPVSPAGADERIRIISTDLITRRQPMTMNLHYGELEATS